MSDKIRVRFAPSPTGSLHIGGARTALYNFLLAKSMNGDFILRVEDTDQERSTLDAMLEQISDLNWLGLEWDEGPSIDGKTVFGKFGPYQQSKRIEIYQDLINKLIDSNQAYYCFLTDEEYESLKQQNVTDGKVHQVQSPYRDMSLDEAKSRLEKGDKATVRFKITEKKTYIVDDLIRGRVELPSDMLVDFVIMRSDGMPVYNFCCVVDDHLMEISHVLRGEEHLPNTLKQFMLYDAFGWEVPKVGHLSVIVDEHRKKLSKRNNAVCCQDFKKMGVYPEALLNYISLLGWSDPNSNEVFDLEYMIKHFTTDRLNASSAAYDLQKLMWVNSQHLRKLPTKTLWNQVEQMLVERNIGYYQEPSWQEKVIALYVQNSETVNELFDLIINVCPGQYAMDDSCAEVLSWEKTLDVLKSMESYLSSIKEQKFLDDNQVKDIFAVLKDGAGVKGKFLFMPMRVALRGKAHGEELKELLSMLSVEEMLSRVRRCLEECQ